MMMPSRRMLLPLIGKRALSAGLGVSAAMLLAERAVADTAFTNFAFTGTGFPTARTMPARIAEVYNVKDWGALGNDPGNLSGHDDTPNIQAALNAACTTGGTLYFPRGQYRITSRLNPPAGMPADMGVHMFGDRGSGNQIGSRIIGSFNDYLICTCYPDPLLFDGNAQGIAAIEFMGFQNFHATGKGILVGGGTGTTVRQCNLNAFIGVRGGNNSFTALCESCTIQGSGSAITPITNPPPVGSVGIYSIANSKNCRVTSFDKGIYHPQTEGGSIIGCSFETNTTAVYLGGTNGFFVGGNQYESNGVGAVLNGGGIDFVANKMIGFGANITGISLGALNSAVLAANICSADCSNAGIDLSNTLGRNIALLGNLFNSTTGPSWKMPTTYAGDFADIAFVGNNNPYTGVVFANLPVAGVGNGAGLSLKEGDVYACSDSPTATAGNFFATVSGGGSTNHNMLQWSGSAWKIVG